MKIEIDVDEIKNALINSYDKGNPYDWDEAYYNLRNFLFNKLEDNNINTDDI